MFEPTLPTTPEEWLPLIAPLVMLLIGLSFFAMPATMLGGIGLAGDARHPNATGEGRSRFAGFLIALPVVAYLFDQPGLSQTIGVAWGIVALGKLINIVVDGNVRLSAVLRFLLAVGLAALVLWQAGRPQPEFVVPVTSGDLVIAGAAALTALYGLFCFLFPGAAATTMGLAPQWRGAAGELRGPVGGVHLAAGLSVLLFAGFFGPLMLGATWLATAFGRIISILSDRAGGARNWLFLMIELALGGAPLAVAFQLVG